MHQTQRHLLYQLKLQSSKRANPSLNPNSEQDDIRAQNQRLRSQIRSKDTEIIRLTGKIEELTQKLMFQESKYKTELSDGDRSVKEKVSQISEIPILLEHKELKLQNQAVHQENLIINQKNNQLHSEIRVLKSQKTRLQQKLKQVSIIQKMREQRFKDQVQRLTPIIVQQPAQFTRTKQAITYLTKFIRERINQVAENIFLLSTRQCQTNKKLNSFTVFQNLWQHLHQNKSQPYQALTSTYQAVKKVHKIFHQTYAQITLSDGELTGSIDEWVVHNVIEIRSVANVGPNEELRRLFRLLALKYRCRFPIKGEDWEMSGEVREYLEDAVCGEVWAVFCGPNRKNQHIADKNTEN